MACLAQPVFGFFLLVCRATPIEGFVLCVALAESESDLGLGEFGAEIKRMRAIRLDAELGIEGKGISRNIMSVAVEYMNSVISRQDSKIRVAHLRREPGDFFAGQWIGRKIVERAKPGVKTFGRGAFGRCREHEPARRVVLLDGAPRMRAHLHREHIADLKLRADARKDSGD